MGAAVEIANPEVSRLLATGQPLHIDLGAGAHPAPGMFTLDSRALPGVDIVADLEQGLTGLPDHCAARLRCSHVLEHIHALDRLMDEMHRVLRPDGVLEIHVPHAGNPLGWSDPTHCRLFGLYSFCYFVPIEQQPLRRKVPCYRTSRHFAVQSLGLGLGHRGFARLLGRIVNSNTALLEWYERRLSTWFPPVEVHAVLRALPDPV